MIILPNLVVSGLLAFISIQDQGTARTSPQVIIKDDAVTSAKHNVRIPAQEPGVIQSFNVREGDRVTKGQVVFEMQKRIHEMQVEAAQHDHDIAVQSSANDVDIRYAEKSLEVAQNELDRDLKSRQELASSVPDSEIDRSRLEVERATLSGEQAKRDMDIAKVQSALKKVELDLAQYRLDRRSTTSPISGIVVERFAQKGEWAEIGQPIMRVIDMDRLYVKVLMDEEYYNQNLVGNSVVFETTNSAGDLVQCNGTVTFVSPELITVRKTFLLWAEIENPDHAVLPGSNGRLKITVD